MKKQLKSKNNAEYVLRLKKGGCRVNTYHFKEKSLAFIRSAVKTIISESFHDIRWTICENGCEIRRGTYIMPGHEY